jgi:hypothetical protein
MQVEFIKERYYKNKLYKSGDIVDMPQNIFKTYQKFKTVKPYHKIKSLDDLSYKELQKRCKEKNLPAVGTRELLILSLKNILKKHENILKNGDGC